MGKQKTSENNEYNNIVNRNYTGDVSETGVNAGRVIGEKLREVDKQVDSIGTPEGWDELLQQVDAQVEQDNIVRAENEKVLQELEKEQQLHNIVKQNQANESWYSGITNFFEAFGDHNDLKNISQRDGKWYQYARDKDDKFKEMEIPYSKVQEIIESQALKMATSGSYQTGVAATNVVNKTIEDGIWGGIYGLGSLLTRSVTGNWDDVNDAQMASLWNRTKYYASNFIGDALSDMVASNAGDEEMEDGGALSFLTSKKEQQIRNAKYDAELKDISAKGQLGLEKRFEEEKARRANGDKLLIDKLYDWSGVSDTNKKYEEIAQLKSTVSARAMEIEGRKKQSFTNVEDKLVDGTFKYVDDTKGINMELPLERFGGADGESKSIWDTQKLFIDASGKPVLDKEGSPMYVDKYSLSQKIVNSNWNVLTDAYYLQDDMAQGVGTAMGFVVGGKGTGALVNATGKGVGKLATATAEAINLENKLFNYTNKILSTTDKVTKPLGKTINTVDRTTFAKTINKVNDKVSKAMMTTAQSYLMSNTESEQIGRQTQQKVLEELIDKYAKINIQEIAQLLQEQGEFSGDSTLFLEAKNQAEDLRKQWVEENPELFNEVLLQSQLAKEQARGINNINFINNLTSAGLFIKGKSFSRNILTNPMSSKGLRKGAWTISREMGQEGLIEEGIINGFAQKAGEETGKMKFYNVSDFFINDVGSSEFAENVFAGAILGGLQTAGTKGVDLRSEYKTFREQKKIVDELSKIGSLDTKENIKKVIEYSLDKANNEAVAQRMNELLSEGKEAEANALADTLLLNKAVKAASSGTTEVLNKSLTDLLNNENMTAEDKQELQKAIAFNNLIADNFDAHIQMPNKKEIIENRGNRFLLENYKQDIVSSLSTLEQEYDQALERQIRKEISSESEYATENYSEIFENKKQSSKLSSDHRTAIELETARKQIAELQETQDALDDSYDYMLSTKGQNEFKQKLADLRKTTLMKNVNESNVEQVREELKDNNELTPEVNSQLNQTMEQRVVDNNTEVVNPIPNAPIQEFVAPDKEQIVKQDTSKIPDNVKQQAVEFDTISQDALFDDEPLGDPSFDSRTDEQIADENESLFLQPLNLNEDNPSHKSIVNRYADVMSKMNETINADFGTNLSAKEMFGLFASSTGFDVAEKHFNFFKKAYEQSGINDENVNWDALYSKYFDKLKSFSFSENSVEAPSTIEEVKKQDEKTNSIIQEDTKPIGFNQDNSPIRYLGRKIATAVNKIPFLGIKYRAVFSELDGSVTYVDDAEGELNTEGLTNLNVVLNPDLLVTGKKFTLEIPEDWIDRTVSVWSTNELDVLVQSNMTMGEWMEKNNVEEGSQEWIDKVPLDMIIDGVNVGSGVHDVNWWNKRNTADFVDATTMDGEKLSIEQAAQRQRNVILAGREMTRNIRRNVIAGNNEMVITDREEGHTLSTPDGTLNSIADSNPSATIAIFSPQGFIVNKGDNGNEYAKENIVNINSITDKGHVFMISRLGTEFKDGKNVPTYVAHKLHTNHDQTALTELAKSRQRLYIAADILNNIGKFANPTPEQISWAETVRDQTKGLTGVSIDNISMEGNNIQYIELGKLKQLYPLPAKNGTGLMLLPQLQNIGKQRLPIVHTDGSVTNYKSKAGEGYKAMLMDNLHTQKKFHTIQDSEGNPMQILDIQPRITFDLVNKTQDVVRQEKQEEVKKAKEKIKVIEVTEQIAEPGLKEDTPLEGITNGQKKKVVQHLFHKILSSIDISKDFTTQDVLNKIKSSFEDHLSDIKGTKEYEYLVENKNSILGLETYSKNINTVKSEIEAFLNQEVFEGEEDTETQLNDEGVFEKNNNKASFENDVRTSLSTKLKMFFAGIEKDNSKTASEDFAGLPSYYGLDEIMGGLQDMLVNVSNNPKSFRNKIENQINKNPEEFGFLQNVLDKFDSAPVEIQKEILFRLNQTKNEMFFVMYSKSKSGNYTLMTYDANSKNPNIKTKLEWQENFKQSDLINNNGDSYQIKLDVAAQLLKQYDSWNGKYENIPNSEYVTWLGHFGIDVSEKTIQDYKDGMIAGYEYFPGLFKENGNVFGVLYSNLKKLSNSQINNPDIQFKYKDEKVKFLNNLLMGNNNNYLKTLIDTHVNNTFNLASNMYIGGKTINAFSQPNYTTEQLRKLKDESNPLAETLRNTAFAQNSMLLNLISNPKIKNALSIGYVSLQSLKQQGQKVYQDSEIVDLSSQDYDLLLQGFFENEGAYFKNQELNDKGIAIREVKMTFPTLSDSSQMFVFNTVGLDLKKGNFTFTDGRLQMNEEVVDMLYSQLVKPDADRIEAYLKSIKNTNVQGLDLGAQLFTMIPSLNSLAVNVAGQDVKLLTVLHKGIKNGNTVDEILSLHRDAINKKLQSVISDSAESKLRIEDNQLLGTWVDNGFVRNEDDDINVSFLDNNYLMSPKAGRGTVNKLEAVQIAAHDFTINYYLNQAQVQMLFAGDIANYVQDKQASKFNVDEKGNIDVTKPKVSVADGENQLLKEQEVYTNIIKATSVNMSKRLKELISPGNRIAESTNEKYIQVMINDVEEASNTLESLVKLWYPELYQENKSDIQKLKQLESKIRRENKEGKSAKVSETEYNSLKKSLQAKFPDVADYFKITATDAQEYTTWKEHLGILLNQGRIQQDFYDSIYSKLESQSKDGINNENKFSKEETKIIFQPLKPLHAGMYFEDLKDAEGNVVSKIQRYVYVKTSSFPLLPQLTQGMELDNVRKNIEELENKTGKKVRVSYQSGNKVGAVKNAINISDLYSDYNPTLEQRIMDSSTMLDRENFSIQQDKPFKTDKNIKNNKRDEINRGTQFEKILLGNGINEIAEKIFPNKFDSSLLESLGITETDGKISGKDLYAIYTSLYAKEQSILRNQLYNSLGLDSTGEWVNNIDTLEHIKNALNKRLSNQQDKEILELVYIVPETNENGELINKYYSKEEIDAKKLKPSRAEFNIPIWMSPNSRKFESVLNSIVNNKLVNLKLPGFSSPVASQEGFRFTDDLASVDNTGIIFTEKFDGELKATHNSDGSLKTAQILVASKFRVKKKNEDTGKYTDELLDLTQYTKQIDGKTVLDMDKVNPDLLEMFSFRIPTSAHQSGALIEIVGFLPHNSGDLMIVPKDHTTQLGEDYDIDTRYVYSQNYRIDSKGNVRKIDSNYVQNRIDALDASLNSDREADALIDDIFNMFDSIRNDEEIQAIFEQEKTTREQKVQLLKDKLTHTLIENQLVDVYKSIFSSTNKKVQKMIGATLSTQFAEDTAEAIDGKLNSTVNNDNFSIFDDRHQKSILKLGASGKLGIGVHSNWVVLNSLFQQMGRKPKLVNGYNSKTGAPIPFNMTIGNFTSYGNLGEIQGLKPNKNIPGFTPRLLSVINMESQNSSTDNQKLQIMGRRNENKYTINVFALMSNLGFDKDVVNGNELSLPSLFISQPIIRRYVELKEQFDSIMSDYQDNVDEKITGILASEFGLGVDLVQTKQGLRMDFDQMKSVESTQLTAQKLYDSLLKGNNAQQWAVYEKFLDLSNHAKNINKVQQLANIDSDGLGISFFNTIAKKDSLLTQMNSENLNIDGIEGLFGEQQQLNNDEVEAQERLMNEGFIKVEVQDTYTVFVKPTSSLNAKLISSIASGYNLWKNIIPFENEFINEQITDIISITGKNPDTKNGLELKYKVVSEMKDFIYSYSNLGIFDSNVNDERKTLFIDTDTNQSLASYLNSLKKSGHRLFNEPFFKDLEFVINKNTEASLVKYTTNERTNFDKNAVYNVFVDLSESKENLPSFNGKEYSFEKLAKDLAKYSLLANQENGAIGFRTHIPVSLFNKYQVTDNLRRYSGVGKNNSHNFLLNGDFKGLMNFIGAYQINPDNTIDVNYGNEKVIQHYVDKINSVHGTSSIVYDRANNRLVIGTDLENFKSIFIRQFFQHNPEEAKKFNWRNNKEWMSQSNSKKLEELEWFVAKDELPEYISIRDSKNSKFLLFEKNMNGVYMRVNTLGGFGFNEYSPFTNMNESLLENNKQTAFVTTQPVINNIAITNDEIGIESGLPVVIQNIINSNSKFKDVAELIQPYIQDVKIEVKNLEGIANGVYVPMKGPGKVVKSKVGDLNRGTIYISQEILNTGNKEKIFYAIMEETVHAITVDHIDKYVDTEESYYNENGEMNITYKSDDVPAHVIKLVSLFKDGAKHILDKYSKDSSVEEAINSLNEQKAIWKNDTSSEFYTNENNASDELRVDTYRTLNLGEFIAGVMLSDKFRAEMNKVKYKKTGQSVLSQFGDVIARLINSLAPNAVKGSVTAHTFDAVMALLNYTEQTASPVSKANFAPTEADSMAQDLLSPDSDNINLGDPSKDSIDGETLSLQPIGLNEIMKIKTC